jgi:hypothetical protein
MTCSIANDGLMVLAAPLELQDLIGAPQSIDRSSLGDWQRDGFRSAIHPLLFALILDSVSHQLHAASVSKDIDSSSERELKPEVFREKTTTA